MRPIIFDQMYECAVFLIKRAFVCDLTAPPDPREYRGISLHPAVRVLTGTVPWRRILPCLRDMKEGKYREKVLRAKIDMAS